MKKTFHLLLCGLFVLNFDPIIAQQKVSITNIEIEKNDFKLDKEGFKEAWKILKNAEIAFSDGVESGNSTAFLDALEFYITANRFNKNVPLLNYKIGICYLHSVNKVNAIQYFENAYSKDEAVTPDIDYWMGRAYHLNYEFEKAEQSYLAFKKKLAPSEYPLYRDILEKFIAECKNGAKLMIKKERVFIDNIGKNVNSKYPDYTPLITADESVLVFTSRRDNTTGELVDPWDEMFYEDIYIAENEDNEWSVPKNIGKSINTKTHDATIGFSPDGQKMFIYYGHKNNGDIYISELSGDSWDTPEALPKTVNSEFRETDASLSPDGNKLYFASNRTYDSFGDFDIFVSIKKQDGTWGAAKNIGGVVNTQYADRAVFMHPDGRTLYFSSQGHNSMGGFDLFYTTLQDDLSWSEPVNLGYPINTPDDDIFFVLSASGKHGYYSSIREDGYGEKDIYVITFLGPEKPLIQGNEDNLIACEANPVSEISVEPVVEIKTMRLTILKGTVKDAITLIPLEADIELVDNQKNEVIATFKSNSKTGKFLVSLPSGINYGIAVKANDYLFHSENFDIPKTESYQEVEKEILLNKVNVGEKIVLKNIFFDLDKATLRSESTAELERLAKLLEDYPTIRIEISGHTDNQGSLTYNTRLSENRAKAVVEYLVSKGIVESRLEFKGYAYLEPIATNDTPEGRQQNRRVEFKILSK